MNIGHAKYVYDDDHPEDAGYVASHALIALAAKEVGSWTWMEIDEENPTARNTFLPEYIREWLTRGSNPEPST